MAHIKDIIGEEAFNALSEDKRKELGKKDFEDIGSGNFIPKIRFDQVNEQAKEYKKQSEQKDTQLSKLKEEYKDVDGLKEKVEKLELDNKTQKETYDKQLSDINFSNALEKGLGAFNVKDKKLIMALIDKDKLKVDGDSVIGLKEQIEPLKTSHDYLFAKEIPGTGSFSTGGDTGSGGQEEKKNTMEIGERLAKEKAEQMKGTETLNDFFK
ncbi:phage scaffolding protein [uncultured Clostridium sp.]|uniref:phage scaffolding protein n=1 Tax=uncultured Clostridium sp. TaxID=59620 RepID=UPI0028E962DA|nr:phage scaffolding protein [uncultured Clostridium sp.]